MKKLIAILLAAIFTLAIAAACVTEPELAPNVDAPTAGTALITDTYNIGFAFFNMENDWDAVVREAVRYGTELGHNITYANAENSITTQISQIETFIQDGVDAIVVLAFDNEAIEGVTREAMDAGIAVVDYSRGLYNTHVTLNHDPHANAIALISMAEPFIREKYGDGEFEWAHLNIPTVEVGVIQGNAIEAEMSRVFPNSRLVFNGATLTTVEGRTNIEAAINVNPDLRVILSQSAGGGIGGNNAIKTAVSPDEYDEWLLFSIGASEQELTNIIAGDPQKGSISLGDEAEHGRVLIDLALRVINGERFEGDSKVVSLPITKVTAENAQRVLNQKFR